MLASDLANREFAGAENPDSRLHVTFYIRPVQNSFKTQKQGRPIFDDSEYVKIEVPGDRNLTLDVPARDEHKERFPLQYARFKNSQSAEEVVGTSIDQWPLLTRSQAEELKAIKFRTVDQIAAASDAQLQSIGMVGGMSPFAFRERAIAFLSVAKDSAFGEHAAQKAKEREEELQQMKQKHEAEMNALKEQVERLTEIALGNPTSIRKPKKRGMPKGGWPKKEVNVTNAT